MPTVELMRIANSTVRRSKLYLQLNLQHNRKYQKLLLSDNLIQKSIFNDLNIFFTFVFVFLQNTFND